MDGNSGVADETFAARSRSLTRALAGYKHPHLGRSLFEIVTTALAFLLVLGAASWSIHHGIWLGALLVLPAGGCLVRLFIIQHDCGHGAFFGRRAANDWVGRVISVFTFTIYDVWRRTHAAHHATSGNLDQRGMGDVVTLTVQEYLARSRWGRLRYRLYRNPLVLFGLGPFFLFIVGYRVPVGLMRAGFRPWLYAMATNAAILAVAALVVWTVGVLTYILYFAAVLTAATLGVWLFYVQHQFEETVWLPGEEWTFQEAALRGSSHYDLPPVLRWFTGNIGIHHVHHLNSRIPFYRLPKVLADREELAGEGRMTLLDSIRCIPLALWDEDEKRLISFRQLRRRHPEIAGARLPVPLECPAA